MTVGLDMRIGIDVRITYYTRGGISNYALRLLPALAALDVLESPRLLLLTVATVPGSFNIAFNWSQRSSASA